MSYLALYRRYRPTVFDDVIGQDHVVKTLKNQIEAGRTGHAYLFTGTRGTGKTTTAKIFAKAINCLEPVNGSPCGKCAACKALSEPSNIDVVEIDAASNNGVNEIRELRENVQFPPVSCEYKVYIIDEVHMLSGAAFNALLKTLEEPPKHAVFILATTEAHKLPATILSRCMRFDFRLVPTETIAELISKIFDEEGKIYDKEAVFAIAKAGEGSIRDALSIADTAISYGSGKLTYEDVNNIIGATSADILAEFIENVLKGESGKVFEKIENLSSFGKSMGVLTKDVTSALRDLLVIKTCNNPNAVLGLPENRLARLKAVAAFADEQRLIRVLEIFAEAETSLRYATHPRVIFETAAIKACRPETDCDIDALVSRIKTLEDKCAALSAANGENLRVIPSENSSGEKAETVKSESAVAEEKTKKDEKPVIAETKIPVESLTAKEIKGKMLYGLRKMGSEMLWNAMQGVGVTAENGEINLIPATQEDYALLTIPANKEKAETALSGIEYFSLNVKEPTKEKQISEIDDATERLKKIFGEDIVIVKH